MVLSDQCLPFYMLNWHKMVKNVVSIRTPEYFDILYAAAASVSLKVPPGKYF